MSFRLFNNAVRIATGQKHETPQNLKKVAFDLALDFASVGTTINHLKEVEAIVKVLIDTRSWIPD